MSFDTGYFERQYPKRRWRERGAKPILDASRLRWLRRRVPSGRLLEVGVGFGSTARYAARWYDVVGLDLDAVVVRNAFVDTSVTGLAGSVAALPLRDGSMDVVVCVDVIEHLPDPAPCLAEIRRVLRPGGYAFFSAPNPEGLGARTKGSDSFIYRDPTHCSVLKIDEWRRRMREAGLEEAWYGTDTLWDPPYVRWLPRRLQWLFFIGLSQLAWTLAPAFRWRHGENFVWLGRRPQ